MNTARALRWQRDAACLDYPQDWWFPHQDCRNSREAKEVCRRCLVRRECLAVALAGNERYGIWAGFATPEIDEHKRVACAVCGRWARADEAADLMLSGRDPRRWKCRTCWYRDIAARRRT